MAVEIRIPSLGESVSQGVIAKWFKQNGDAVEADEILFELETDKASMEIPAEAAGTLEILKPEGSEVEVGTVVGRIAGDGKGAAKKQDGDGAAAAKAEPAREEPKKAAAPARPEPEKRRPEREEPKEAVPAAGAGAPLSPSVRKLVAEHGLDAARIPASGKGGRLTKGDVLGYLERGPSGEEAPEPSAEAGAAAEPAEARPAPSAPRPAPAEGEETERVRMTLLRRRIAERLVQAQHTSAILTTFNEIDMSAVMALRKRHKERFQQVHGVGLGFMSLFGRAVIQALREVPVVNAQIDGDEIVYFKRVHLGIAVGTERGLVVPVVRDADLLSIAELEKAIGEVAKLARDRKLLPDQLAGGTFTISNGGVYGSLLSTPILNPPQSGVLGMHKIEERAVVVGGEVVVRPMMYVALSYDHRLVDGEQAVTFLVHVKERLEDPARLLLEI